MTFEEKCYTAFDRFTWLYELRKTPRSGLILLGYYEREDDEAKLSQRKTINALTEKEKANTIHVESVAEHIFACNALEFLLRNLFAEECPWLKDEHAYEELLLHEIGEYFIGDLPDDGSNDRKKKDQIELEYFKQFIAPFPAETRDRLTELFIKHQQQESFNYLVDKFAFIFSQAFEILTGNEGEMHEKARQGALSEQDMHYVWLTQSTRAIDNTYAHCLEITRGIPGREIFIGMMKCAYNRFGEEVPATIQKLY